MSNPQTTIRRQVLEEVLAAIRTVPRCPFDGPTTLKPTDPCPVCGDLGTDPTDDDPPSLCQSAAGVVGMMLKDAETHG